MPPKEGARSGRGPGRPRKAQTTTDGEDGSAKNVREKESIEQSSKEKKDKAEESEKAAARPAPAAERSVLAFDPEHPLFTIEGAVAACDDNGKLIANLYKFHEHFSGEPRDASAHGDPDHPGLRAGEAVPEGLKSWDHTSKLRPDGKSKGGGWIASRPAPAQQGAKKAPDTAWFNINVWGSWRLAFLGARLQREIWLREQVQAVGALEAPMAVEATEAVAAPKPAEAPAAAEPTATEAKAVDEALPASELAEVPEAAKAPTAAEEPKAAEAPQAVETPTAAEASVAAEPAQDEPTAAEQAELERAAAKEEEDTAGDEEGARAATVTPHDHEAAEEPSTDEAPEAIAPPAKRVYVAPEIAQALNMQAYNPAASAAEAPAAEETPQAAEAPAAAETPQVEQVPVAAEAPRSSDAPEAPAAAEAEVAQDDGWVVLPEAQAYDQAEAEEAELAKQAAQEEVRAMRAAAADTSQLKEEQGQGKEDEVEEESTDLDKVTAMYESTSDTDCGWGEDDPNDCQWSNQAYINGKERTKEKIDEASIMEACGVMCAKAGEQCGGFSWISARKICYFRKNAKCGVIQRTGIKCYQKKSP